MDIYKGKISKMDLSTLVNELLRLNEEHKDIPPENEALLTDITMKIGFVQDIIATFKKDVSSSKSLDGDKLMKSRTAHLGQITKLQTKFELEYDKLKDSSEEQRLEILVNLDQVTSSLTYQLTQIEAKTNKLELLLDEELLHDVVSKNAVYSEKVFFCKSQLSSLKETQKSRLALQSKAVLPAISIKKFGIKTKSMYAEFQQFKASFDSLFVSNGVYTKVQLFNYLISFLSGQALELTMRYSMGQDFESAYRELNKTYDRKDLLITECLEFLENLEKPKGNASSMRTLYHKQNHTVSLLFQFIGESVKVDEAILMRSLLNKVPYTYDKQYREFLAEKELERQKDITIVSLTRDIQALSSISGHTSELAIPESVSTAQISSNVENYFIFFERYLNNLEYLEILHPKKGKRQGIKIKGMG